MRHVDVLRYDRNLFCLALREKKMRFTAKILVCITLLWVVSVEAQSPEAGSETAAYQGLEPGVFMKRWLVCGPFPVFEGEGDPPDAVAQTQAFERDFLIEHGGEAKIRPQAALSHHLDGAGYRWEGLETWVNLINLVAQYGQKDYAIAYAWAEIQMEEADRYLLGIASDDAVKVWLNGELIHENWTKRSAHPDSDLVAAEFQAGTNHLLIKVQNGEGLWQFACRRVHPRSLGAKLLPAVSHGDTAMVELCLSSGVEVDQADEHGFTALQLARMHGHEALAALLLEHGADPNREVPVAGTPLGFLDILWTSLQENYPMMEYAGAIDESWYESCKAQIEDMNGLFQALPLMDQMLVQRLNDYHTSMYWEGKPHAVPPPIHLDLAEDQIVVTQSPQDQNVTRGDIVLAVNDVNARECFDNAFVHAFGATPYAKTRSACRNMLAGESGSQVTLKLRNAHGKAYEVRLERGAPGLSGGRGSVLSSRVIDDDIGYIRIRSWTGFSPEEFDAQLEPLREKPYLILDVRDNGGGADNLAAQVIGRFISKKVLCSVSFQRQVGTDSYEKLIHMAEPRGPWCYEGKVAVLTNAGCASACEHFVSGVFEAGALLVGTPTSGACGWSKNIDLPVGVKLRCSLTFPIHGKVPSPLNGMPPHHLVMPTIEDIRAGRDTVLERAVSLLNGSQQ